MSEPLVRTEPLGGSALARLAAAGAAPPSWYPPVPRGSAAWRERAEAVRASFPGAAWLDALRPAFSATGRAAERLERAAAAGVLVTTGQQPGLFGGPVYTWSKALSALAFADALEASTGVPTAPIFWAATDDADFAEAAVTRVALPGGVERLELGAAVPEGTPMADVPLGGEVEGLLRALERAAGSAANAPALEAVRRAYQPAATVGSAYCTLLRELLEPCGIAVLDASHPAARAAAFPLLVSALARAEQIEAALAERSRELAERGLAPQVTLVAGLSLVFASSGYAAKRRLALTDARDAASRATPGGLSPNVLLRPVVERSILPTVAYMAGPGELGYFAQVSAVAEALGAHGPLALPRWSGTIVEPHVARILRRLAISEEELRDPHAVETRLARAAAPAALRLALDDAARAIELLSERLRQAPEASALVPEPVVEGARRALLLRLQRLERRYLAALKRREVQLLRDVATARASLYPDGLRQERALNFVPFLARYGTPLVEEMHARAGAHASQLSGLEPIPRATALA